MLWSLSNAVRYLGEWKEGGPFQHLRTILSQMFRRGKADSTSSILPATKRYDILLIFSAFPSLQAARFLFRPLNGKCCTSAGRFRLQSHKQTSIALHG